MTTIKTVFFKNVCLSVCCDNEQMFQCFFMRNNCQLSRSAGYSSVVRGNTVASCLNLSQSVCVYMHVLKQKMNWFEWSLMQKNTTAFISQFYLCVGNISSNLELCWLKCEKKYNY